MKGVSQVTSLIILTVITLVLAGTAYTLSFNIFNAYNPVGRPNLSPQSGSCDLNVIINDVCFNDDNIQITATKTGTQTMTSNSYIVLEGSLFTAVIPFTPPHKVIDSNFVMEVDYRPNVLGTVQKIIIKPLMESPTGDIMCDESVFEVETQKQC